MFWLSPELLGAALPVTALAAFWHARTVARHSRELRSRYIRRATVGMAIGGVIGAGSWFVLPTNRESPAMLITYFTSIVIGGGLSLYSLIILLGAVLGKPHDGEVSKN